MKKITIGVTDCSKYGIYENWIRGNNPNIEAIKLSEHLQNYDDAQKCDGILFTGGEDVHPKFYNKPEYYEYCYKEDVSELRDDFDLKLLDFTEKNQIPVLGICRGLQVINVYFGGTLIPDIPTWGKWNHSKHPDNSDRYHAVNLDPNSWLKTLVGEERGIINSNHHQAVEMVGKGLVVNAFSEDGVVEGLERKDPTKSYLCLIQWHPERMKDMETNPFSWKIRESFWNACKSGF